MPKPQFVCAVLILNRCDVGQLGLCVGGNREAQHPCQVWIDVKMIMMMMAVMILMTMVCMLPIGIGWSV